MADSEGFGFENSTQRTSTAFSKFSESASRLHGNKIYIAWFEDDVSGYKQLWRGSMNVDGTGWNATQLTSFTSATQRYGVTFEIVGNQIHFVWCESLCSSMYTGETSLNGTSITPVLRQSQGSSGSQQAGQITMGSDGNKLYYMWNAQDSRVYTGSMNLDGTNFSAVQQASTILPSNPDLYIKDGVIYYAWSEYDIPSSRRQIWTATMNTDLTGWSATQRTTSSSDKQFVEIKVDSGKVYMVWQESDGSNHQIATAVMNANGSGFSSAVRTNTASTKYFPNLVVKDPYIYYIWSESDGSNDQVWTAQMDTAGTTFAATKQTTSAFSKWSTDLLLTETKIYYNWNEPDGSGFRQIWTADGTYTKAIDDSSIVTATVPSSLTFTVAGVSSGAACANSGGNASVTTTSSTIPFGTYTGAATKIACQTLTVSTNATNGYVVTVEQNQVMTSGGGDTMKAFSGTYGTPTTWATPPGLGTESYFGFTTDDTDYSNFQTAKYGSFAADETPYNIAVETDPVADEVNVMSYQLEVTDLQESGIYTNNIMYVATAIF